ncbi:MAG: TonB-dependent receptor [Gemmatimonadota bacterium]|nr:TonB-dependent receptor [Gemmatimonadota bacterium]
MKCIPCTLDLLSMRARGGVIACAVAAVVCAPLTAPAQARVGQIVGTVVDAHRGDPVTAAHVRLVELHRSEPTHDDGSFRLRDVPPGRYTLVAQRIGYRLLNQSVIVRPGETTTVRVAMEPAAVQLRAQVVTGTITARPGEELLSPTSVLTDAALERRLSATVGETLEGEPGVAVTSIGPATARPVVRGLGGDRILVLEDGQRPGDMSSLSGDHALAIDPLMARQMEVVRGPMSLLYGSSALGGVVNVVREEVPESVPEHLHGRVTSQGESVYRGGAAGAELLTRLGPRIALRGEGSIRGAADTRTPTGRLPNTESATFGGALGAGYVHSRGHAGASYRFYANNYGIPGGFVGAHPEGVDIRMRRHTGRVEGERHFADSPLSAARGTAVFTHYRHTELERSGRVGTLFEQDQAAGDVLLRHDSIGPIALGALGLRGQYRDIATGGSLRTPSTYDYTLAAFLVEEIGRRALRAQIGGRYDFTKYVPREAAFIDVGDQRVPVRPRTFNAVSGAVGLLYAAREDVRVGTSVSRAYRTPDFNELYSNGPHLAANAFEVGDPTLRAETGVGVDVFVRVTRDRVRLELATFRNWLGDYISSSSRGQAIESQQGAPLFQFTNEDAVFTGAEGAIEAGITSRLVAEVTVSYVEAQFTSDRAPIPVFTLTPTRIDTTFIPASQYPSLIPPLNGRVELRYERLRAFGSGGVRFAARQNRTGDFEEPTDGYTIANVTAGYRFLAGSQLHTLTLGVENVFDTEYRNHLSRVKAIMPEPGRNVRLLYRLTF